MSYCLCMQDHDLSLKILLFFFFGLYWLMLKKMESSVLYSRGTNIGLCTWHWSFPFSILLFQIIEPVLVSLRSTTRCARASWQALFAQRLSVVQQLVVLGATLVRCVLLSLSHVVVVSSLTSALELVKVSFLVRLYIPSVCLEKPVFTYFCCV